MAWVGLVVGWFVEFGWEDETNYYFLSSCELIILFISGDDMIIHFLFYSLRAERKRGALSLIHI